ncbi:hypothetical protein BH708_12635 [Brachybacterium sp. P6-10-X1]|uniref:hypothetical protein n=1 Tax=Brachybacterium sp. P6-10-X1 TaxID=1903186 RepID=UPI000971B366|nr:hypothetical protein [Brachybacterium sp. P6-10-X1]APX33425.1 hypothetical protein BH708_12635 [Brachybacterium sp. P6-10-X1]
MPAPQPAVLPAAPGAPLPAAPSSDPTGTETSRRLLGAEPDPRALTLWGSSSMCSEGGDESTPLPIRIHEHLALSAAPASVHSFGVGATRSAHTLLMRGLDTPRVTPIGESVRAADGIVQVPVALDPALAPAGPLRIPGTISGAAGVLDGSSGSWFFTADDAARDPGGALLGDMVEGVFTSALAEVADASRQVLWMGKNNILDVAGVLSDTQRMWDAAQTPEEDTLVLGQWRTEADPDGSPTGDAVGDVNTEQARRYGKHFLDLQQLLTGEAGLRCSPLAPLALLEQGSTQDALERGVVPPLLVAADGIHLNGWGNLAVSWALVRRMRELGWL